MDKKAFERARETFKKKTADLTEEAAATTIERLVDETRSEPPPTLHLLGGLSPTYSSEAVLSKGSSTLAFSSAE